MTFYFKNLSCKAFIFVAFLVRDTYSTEINDNIAYSELCNTGVIISYLCLFYECPTVSAIDSPIYWYHTYNTENKTAKASIAAPLSSLSAMYFFG